MKKLILITSIVFGSSSIFSQTINITPAQFDSFISVRLVPSAARSYVVQGTGLINDIVISSEQGEFQVSLSNSPFVPVPSIHLTPVGGVVAPTTIYVRMYATLFPLMLLNYDNIVNASTGAVTKNVAVSGYVLAPEPTSQSTIHILSRTNNSITLNTTGGNGTYQMLVAKESAPVDFVPQDTREYPSGLRTFGVGFSAVGNGNYVVATEQLWVVPTTITGLTPGKTYYFSVFDFGLGYYDGPLGAATYSENYLLPGNTDSATTTNFGGPLPILINYIHGTKQGSKHLLNWKVTCISTPRVTMSLERSADSRNFTPINSITADAVRCNQPFDYTDTDPLKGMNYYRLKMIDADGKISYSSIVALLNAVKGFDMSIAPNPVVDNNLKLNVASAQAGKMDISIFDMQGRLVNRQTVSVIAGFNNLPINVANLSPGTYTIQGTITDDRSRVIRFVKQ